MAIHEQKPNLNTLPMLRLQRDIDALMGGRRPLALAGRKTAVLSAFTYFRELPAHASPILFLLHAPKRQIRPAHDRNKLKRWMREAIRGSEEIKQAYALLHENNIQALILIRATEPPSKRCQWLNVQADVAMIGKLLAEKSLSKEGNIRE